MKFQHPITHAVHTSGHVTKMASSNRNSGEVWLRTSFSNFNLFKREKEMKFTETLF